jgi:hypothetical protein
MAGNVRVLGKDEHKHSASGDAPHDCFGPIGPEFERAAVTGSRQQLWTRVGRSSSNCKIECNYVMLESDELEFNATATLERSEIKNTIGEIRKASMDSDRLTPVMA